MLILGIVIPAVTLVWSLSLSDQRPCNNDIPFSCLSPRSEISLLALAILFLAAVIGIIWQIISWFLHHKFKENQSQSTQKIRKITKIYYTLLVSFCLFSFLFSVVYSLSMDSYKMFYNSYDLYSLDKQSLAFAIGVFVSGTFSFSSDIFQPILYLAQFIPQIILLLFILSPVFWLIYYVNLFGQRSILKQRLKPKEDLAIF